MQPRVNGLSTKPCSRLLFGYKPDPVPPTAMRVSETTPPPRRKGRSSKASRRTGHERRGTQRSTIAKAQATYPCPKPRRRRAWETGRALDEPASQRHLPCGKPSGSPRCTPRPSAARVPPTLRGADQAPPQQLPQHCASGAPSARPWYCNASTRPFGWRQPLRAARDR